ncbi:MAG: D-inositol-3-phosphate glycosyltransferase [Planctomycetes bacterium]|nr:D-inositol-3-phosphate glycosyltransferase [Planctomycetota bacterium]
MGYVPSDGHDTQRTPPAAAPMIIGISAVTGTQGGPRTYALELARSLAALPGDDRVVLLADDPAQAPRGPRLGAVRVPMPFRAARPLCEAWSLPRIARRERLDVLHGTKQTLPAGLPCAGVVSIHDLAPHLMPGTFPRLSGAWLRRSAAAAARRADLVLTGSGTTARDLRDVLGVDPARIAVTPYGVEERFRAPQDAAAVAGVRARHGLPERYLACVGTIQPRKNVDVVLDAMELLASRGRDVPPLALAGRVGWMSDEVVARARRSPLVRWLGSVPDADLPPLLAGAHVFVSPSSYEGFGLAVAEAMAAGAPVIGGSGSSLDEVVGTAGLLVPPRDAAALADAVDRLLGDDALRARLAREGREKARSYTWEATARATLDAYRRAVGARR